MPQIPTQPDKIATFRRAAGKLYGRTADPADGGGSIDLSLQNYYHRKHASLRDDAEGLRQSRQESNQLRAYAERKKIRPDDLHRVLAVVHEYESMPRSAGTVQKLWPETFETLRLEHGGIQQAQQFVAKGARVASELVREVPSLGHRASNAGAAAGAANDIRVLKVLALYADEA